MRNDLPGRTWRYRHCPSCGEEAALLLWYGAFDRAECMTCWQERYPGDRPRHGDVAWAGAPAAMVDYWLG